MPGEDGMREEKSEASGFGAKKLRILRGQSGSMYQTFLKPLVEGGPGSCGFSMIFRELHPVLSSTRCET